MTSKFKTGSGAFRCGCCKRLTRDVGDNGDLGLCPECCEVAALENQIADCGDPDGKIALEIDRLNAAVVSKGGALGEN